MNSVMAIDQQSYKHKPGDSSVSQHVIFAASQIDTFSCTVELRITLL
jgi:hypothetical protein